VPLTSERRTPYLIALLVIVVPLFSFGLANHGLWTADEPRVAEIGREMALPGASWAVPTLDRKPFLEEPPLYYASLAAAFRLFGKVSDGVARVPSAVFAFGGVVALFFLGSLLFGPRTGFASALVMATSGEYFRVAHWVIVDSALAFFVILALVFFMTAYLSARRTTRLAYYSLCYISCTLAFYTKGFIGVVIPGLAVLTFLVFDRNTREILRMHLWLGILIFAAMTLPWFLSLWQQGGGEYLRVFLVHNHLERFAGGSTGHHQPFYYYLVEFPTAFLPWGLIAIPVLWQGLRRRDEGSDRSSKGRLFILCWFISGFVFLSVSSTKRALYLMPLFAPISLLTAVYIDGTITGKILSAKWEKVFTCAFGLLPLVGGLAAVPALVFASKRFGFGLNGGEVALVVVLSVAAVALSAAALREHSRNMMRLWGFSSASVLSLLFLGLIAVMPILDGFKSFVPFCNAIRESVPASETLYAWQPDETLRGAVPFYTGRFLEEVDSMPRLAGILQRERTVFVVVRDKDGELEKELLSTGRMRVTFKLTQGTDRSLAILRNTGAGPADGSARPPEHVAGERNERL
jgi:4-amino-4-deoxy-L-arabinose transferase-like glycosyltransferase